MKHLKNKKATKKKQQKENNVKNIY